jgi:hypothetical protein
MNQKIKAVPKELGDQKYHKITINKIKWKKKRWNKILKGCKSLRWMGRLISCF